jgi:serine/threonine-protein kinase
MAETNRLGTLLLRYEELRAHDTPVSPEELCQNCPEMVPELKREIRALESINALLGGGESQDDSAAVTPSDQALPGESVPWPAEDLKTGSRYQVLRFHAKGGLGEVHVARDQELDREVALKRLQTLHARNPQSRERFLREAAITSRLDHPSIVPVHTMGQDAAGCPFYAMRFVQGQTLQEAIEQLHALKKGKVSLRQLLSRFVAVCNTLAYAHSKGIVHRDIKPDNIMLGAYGETLVVDWGLAKDVRAREGENGAAPGTENGCAPSLSNSNSPTQMGAVIGTPAFMSPEQAEGRWDLVGPASDVYSLGATLYVLLTGQRPFQANHVGAIVDQVKRGDFLPPRQCKKDLPRALEAICLKAMARLPENRYGTPLDMAADLEHWLADEPVSAWREPWTVRVRRWLGRHRTMVAAAAATVLMATVSLAMATWLSMEAKARAQATAKELAAAVQNERAAKNLALDNLLEARQAVRTFYSGVGDRLWRIPGTQESRKRLLEDALEFYNRVLPQMLQEPGLRAEAHFRLGYLAEEMGSKDKALEEYRRSRSVWEALAGDFPAQGRLQSSLAQSCNLMGAMQLDLGQRDGAFESYQQARMLFQKRVEADASAVNLQGLALSCHGLASLQEEPAAALGYYQQGISWQIKLVAANPKATEFQGDLAQSYNNLGALQSRMGQREAGLRSLEQARVLRTKLVQDNPMDAQFQGNLADSYLTLGLVERVTDPTAARRSLEQARVIAMKLFETHPAVASFQNLLAEIDNGLGLVQQATDPAAAEHCFLQACGNFEKLVQAHPEVRQYRVALAQSYHNLGALRKEMKQPAEARRAFEQACVLWDWFLERDKGPGSDRVHQRRALTQAQLQQPEPKSAANARR